ncbi:MmcQ/YjbR family DNA-binding protein [Pontibacter sp. CAU 1760]
MEIEELQAICAQLPGITEDVKWGNDLCFCVAGKMFLVVALEQVPTSASFKVPAEEFATLSEQAGFTPAPYTARYNWVLAKDIRQLGKVAWEAYIRQSYALVVAKLPKEQRQALETI